MEKTKQSNRILTLDLLRGFFIFVIIADHLIRWPSPLAWLTGQGRLWVSAAEGFFIISGLLVGYTRGYKKRTTPFSQVSKLLLQRAAVLYVSATVGTLILTSIYLHLQFPPELQPALPSLENSYAGFIGQILSLKYVVEWMYFLKLYIGALIIAPFFIFLLRKHKFIEVIIVSCLLLLLGTVKDIDWLQWQVLFFVPAVAGYNLEDIRKWWNKLASSKRRIIRLFTTLSAFITLCASSFWVFGWKIVESPNYALSFDSYVTTRWWLDPIFSKSPLSPTRVLLAFLWFCALFLFVRKFERMFVRLTGWLLLTFGERSLSAYFVHGFVLVFVQSFVPLSTSSILNTVIITGSILVVYFLLKIPSLQRYLPS